MLFTIQIQDCERDGEKTSIHQMFNYEMIISNLQAHAAFGIELKIVHGFFRMEEVIKFVKLNAILYYSFFLL